MKHERGVHRCTADRGEHWASKPLVLLYFICPHLVGCGAGDVIVTQLINVNSLVG